MMQREEGSVLIVALMMLVLLTMLGIAATRTTEIDLKIAGNHLQATKAFHGAESGLSTGYAELRAMEEAAEFGAGYATDINWQVIGDNTDYSMAGNTGRFEFIMEQKLDDEDDIVLCNDEPVVVVNSTGWSGSVARQAEAVVEGEFCKKDVFTFPLETPLYVDGVLEDNGSASAAIGEWDSECDAVADIVSTGPVQRPDNWQGDTGANGDDFRENAASYDFDTTFNNLMQLATPIEPENNLVLGDEETMGIYSYTGDEFRVQNLSGWGILLIDSPIVEIEDTIGGKIEWHGIIMNNGPTVFNGGGSQEIFGAFLGKGDVITNGKPHFLWDCNMINTLVDKYEHYRMTSWKQK